MKKILIILTFLLPFAASYGQNPFSSYNTNIANKITNQTMPNSITHTIVGNAYTDLSSIVYLNFIKWSDTLRNVGGTMPSKFYVDSMVAAGSGGGSAWTKTGNAFGASANMGMTDNYSLSLIQNSLSFINVSSGVATLGSGFTWKQGQTSVFPPYSTGGDSLLVINTNTNRLEKIGSYGMSTQGVDTTTIQKKLTSGGRMTYVGSLGYFDTVNQLTVGKFKSTGADTLSGIVSVTANGAASTPALSLTGSLYTGGTGTTTVPFWYINQGATAPTTFSTAGTILGINATSTFTGNFLDFHINGSSNIFYVDNLGQFNNNNSVNGNLQCQVYNTSSGTNAAAVFSAQNYTGAQFQLSKFSNNYSNYLNIRAGDGNLYNGVYGNISITNAASNRNINFATGGVATPQLTIFSSGNVSIGGGFTDNTYSLDVRATNGIYNAGALTQQGIATFGSTSQAGSSRLGVPVAPTASANYGMVSLGDAPFDGSTAGKFVGSSSGTVLAANITGSGDFVNLQKSGVVRFQVDNVGHHFIYSAANSSMYTATLSSGTVTVSNTSVTANSKIFVTAQTCTSCGTYSIGTITAGTSFVINSTNVSDASTIAYWIIN